MQTLEKNTEINPKIKEITTDTTQLKNYPNLYFRIKPGYLENALLFQITNQKLIEEEGCTRTLTDCLESLNRVAQNSGDIAILYEDFVKHSFYFVLYSAASAQKDFNGGIILHGYEETFSVELTTNNKPHWSIHT